MLSVPDFVRFFFSAVLTIVLLAAASTQPGTPDPVFEKIPFDRWLGEPPNPNFHWKVRVPRAELSFHQRLVVPVEIELDGRDLETRRDHGSMVFLIQITDRVGTLFRHHTSIELSKFDANLKAAALQIAQPAFILPGDYQLAVALFDATTNEHSATQTQFHVAEQRDFLPEAWRDLPPVEFIERVQSPDSWYLPNIQGRLQWAASAHSPPRLNVILNVDSSVSETASRPTPTSGLPALLPILKVLAHTGSPALSDNVSVLDIGRRRAVFSQNDVKDLDWPGLKSSLGVANAASIDVHSLSERHRDAQFFVSEVRRVLRASETPGVLVVLTTAVAFESGEDLTPISLEGLPPFRVFYIRYRTPVAPDRPFDPQMRGRGFGGRMGGRQARNEAARRVVDQLEATLRPLHPKVFDVETPEEMTKALKEIRDTLLSR